MRDNAKLTHLLYHNQEIVKNIQWYFGGYDAWVEEKFEDCVTTCVLPLIWLKLQQIERNQLGMTENWFRITLAVKLILDRDKPKSGRHMK